MKKTLIAVMTSVIALMGCNDTEQESFDPNAKYDLQVKVTGVTNEGGNVYIAVRAEDKTVIAEHLIPANEASASTPILLEQIPSGRYAIFTFQDIDGNNELTMAGMMPDEPLGYSGNTRLMGPPQFSATSFALVDNSQQTVMLFDYR
ncbi:DUF2141 domain-containing protein [Vibrio sonorensis]|uniref:DUF2141 domain-containing protein n=1 Tax=Vibrio sonorensis TaxID=1004316 RepID=UPI0008D93C87|nr:DUF2141 domain-containing protein [Vibrio sonorensis]